VGRVAARRCSTCAVNYPTDPSKDFETCAVCEDRTSYLSNAEPDEDWHEHVAAGIASRERAEAIKETVPRITGTFPMQEVDGRFFVKQSDLYHAGLRDRSKPGSLFSANGMIWELVGLDFPNRRWFIEEIYPAESLAELDEPPQAVEPGPWVDEFLDQVLGGS